LLAAGSDRRLLLPIGFWLLPLVSGIAGLVLTLTFAVSDTWRNRALSAFFGPERARLWEKPFGKSAALWAMLTFGFVGVVFGSLSKQHRQNGGLLAEHLSAVSSLQQLVGINVSILDEQKKTRQATEGLVQLEKTGIADNPRVTLSKQGIAWSEESFMEALGSGNADDVALFLQGGMRFTFGSLGRAFIHYTPQVAEVIRAHADAVSADACMFGGNEAERPWVCAESQRGSTTRTGSLTKIVCGCSPQFATSRKSGKSWKIWKKNQAPMPDSFAGFVPRFEACALPNISKSASIPLSNDTGNGALRTSAVRSNQRGRHMAALVFRDPCGHPWPFLLAASHAAAVPGLIGEARCVALTRDAVRGSVASSQGPRGGLIWERILPGRQRGFRALGNARPEDASTLPT
jgi:hypothetical protein